MSTIPEHEVLREEQTEIWRGRLRRRLPFPPFSKLKSGPLVLEWISDALGIARCIDDGAIREEAERALLKRRDELLDRHKKIGSVAPDDARWLDDVHGSLSNLSDPAILEEIFTERRVGLSLSGGGVRSSSFNLGILESLYKHRALDHMDYLSTVSGGGYIGAALTLHTARDRLGFPFADPDKALRKSRTDWIRAHASYLNSGREVGTLTLIASVLRGIVLNLLFIVPFFFGIMWLLTADCDSTMGFPLECDGARTFLRDPLGLALTISAAAAVFFSFQKSKGRRRSAKFPVTLFWVIVLWFVAVVLAFLLTPDTSSDSLGLYAFLFVLVPLALVALRTLLGHLPKIDIHFRKRLHIVITEGFAWFVVAGSMYLILDRLPLEKSYPLGYLCLAAIGMALLLKLLANFMLMTLLSGSQGRFNPVEQRTFSVEYGDLLGLGLIFLGLGSLPFIDQLLRGVWHQYSDQFLGGLTVTGLVSTATGWLKRGSGNENKGYVAYLLRFGVTVLIGAALLWMYRLAGSAHGSDSSLEIWQWSLIIFVWALAAMLSDLNYMSMHRYYRNRLADAFLLDPAHEAVIDSAEQIGLRITEEAAAYLRLRAPSDPEERKNWLGDMARNKEGKKLKLLTLYHSMSRKPDKPDTALEAMDAAIRDNKMQLDDEAKAYLAARVGLDTELRSRVLGALKAGEHSWENRLRSVLPKSMANGGTLTLADAKAAVRETDLRGMRLDVESELTLRNLDVGQSGSLYHIINTNLVLPGSKSEAYRVRRGDSFIFTPRHIGSKATLWERTESKNARGSSLGTAMAVSGAAVDPNTGATLSSPLRIIMTLLNVRLGFWQTRPGCQPGDFRRFITQSWPVLVVREMFGLMHEHSDHVRLSDGGHFENLGLYELVRRRCDLIVVCDAAADPKYRFADLARAVERVRVDFGADIEIDTADLQPKWNTRRSKSPFVRGTIRYRNPDKDGEIILIKSTLFSGLSEDILGYARTHSSFPDQTTADQFFSEEQFEAYRQLGFRAMKYTAPHISWLNRNVGGQP